MRPPPKTDPASSPRFPFRGEVKRQRPIWERLQFGPWQSDARVVPITGMRAGYPLLEINLQWQHGPPLDTSLGPTPATGMAAQDVYVIDRQARDLQLSAAQASDLAVAAAKFAGDLLAAGVKPDLPAIVRELRSRLK